MKEHIMKGVYVAYFLILKSLFTHTNKNLTEIIGLIMEMEDGEDRMIL